MKLIDIEVKEFLNEIDKGTPTPGGGSVSALASAIAASLTRMVGHLTVGKKKFNNLNDENKDRFTKALSELKGLKDQLTKLVDQDTEAYNLVMSAYRMAKFTDEEKETRKHAIQKATLGAIEVPYQVALLSKQAMLLLPIIKQFGNKNCLSDLGVSMLMLKSGALGALMNVKINLSGLQSEKEVMFYSNELETMKNEVSTIANKFVETVFSEL